MTSGSALRDPSGIGLSMQVRALLLAFALLGAGCRSVSEPAAALAAPLLPPLPPIPQFALQPVWDVRPRGKHGFDLLVLWNLVISMETGSRNSPQGKTAFPRTGHGSYQGATEQRRSTPSM